MKIKFDIVSDSNIFDVRSNSPSELAYSSVRKLLNETGIAYDAVQLRKDFLGTPRSCMAKTIETAVSNAGCSGGWTSASLSNLIKLTKPVLVSCSGGRFLFLRSPKCIFSTGNTARGKTLDRSDIQAYIETNYAGEYFSICSKKLQTRVTALELLKSKIKESKREIGAAIGLSVILQLLILTMPLYIQMSVDNALNNKSNLLTTLTLAFSAVAVFHIFIEWYRRRLLSELNARLNESMTHELFSRLVRLPIGWFSERNIGDVASRFGSTKAIRDLVTSGLIAGVIDAGIAILALVVMVFYSALLSFIVFGSFILSSLIEVVTYKKIRVLEENAISSSADERSFFIESIRVIQSIKLFSHEKRRVSLWKNKFSLNMQDVLSLDHWRSNVGAVKNFVSSLENIIVIYIGVMLVAGESISVGMLFAFMSYKLQFLSACSRGLETFTKYKLMGLHVERISDISDTKIEYDPPNFLIEPICDSIKLKNIVFRYDGNGVNILNGVHVSIQKGQFVAIVGASGCGKTTLLKLILGLLQPSEGTVEFGGLGLENIGVLTLRKQVSAVMQEDYLLSGTVAENISMFSDNIDEQLIVECAKISAIHEDIIEKPEGYDAEIGEMGCALSGGQRQRLLLARALYKRPKVLLLDEGTSHLDIETEKKVNNALSHLGITRIFVAHRPNTIQMADIVYRLHLGKLYREK